jgi:hypothetical protein
VGLVKISVAQRTTAGFMGPMPPEQVSHVPDMRQETTGPHGVKPREPVLFTVIYMITSHPAPRSTLNVPEYLSLVSDVLLTCYMQLNLFMKGTVCKI